MTIEVGKSGGGLIMPSSSYISISAIGLKSAAGTLSFADASGFWTAIDLSHTPLNYETVKLAASADTTEQTILDITDSGVLTHVIAPALSGSGTMTIRVTVDGTVKTFVSQTMAAGGRFCLGAFIPGSGQTSTSGTVGWGSNVDAGFSITAEKVLLPTPNEALSLTNAGLVFKTSLKVTIQGSVNITATAEQLNGCANYSLLIPEGL